MSLYSTSLGTVYGLLTIVELMGVVESTRGAHHKVRVRCECGVDKIVWFADLRRGATKTCGNKTLHNSLADRTAPAFRSIYRDSYKVRAKKKGLAFDLTEEQFRAINAQDCHYCGIEPSTIARIKNRASESVYIYNGVDRKDSSLGYMIDNVVPCCSICNHAKHTMSYETFCAWLDRVAATRAKRELHCIEI